MSMSCDLFLPIMLSPQVEPPRLLDTLKKPGKQRQAVPRKEKAARDLISRFDGDMAAAVLYLVEHHWKLDPAVERLQRCWATIRMSW